MICVLYLFAAAELAAQDTSKPFTSQYKNSIQAEAFGGAYIYSVNYERLLITSQKFTTAGQAGLAFWGSGSELVSVFRVDATEIIGKKTGQSVDDLRQQLEVLIITQGKDGAHLYEQEKCLEIPTFPVSDIKDPTGAGDAFRGGFLRGLASGWPMQISGEVGALCASYALENVGTQNHHFERPEFVERFRKHSDDNGLLDELLEPVS